MVRRLFLASLFVSDILHSNLYGAEYKKSHPHVTVGEYRVVWDGIDETIRKVHQRSFSFRDPKINEFL